MKGYLAVLEARTGKLYLCSLKNATVEGENGKRHKVTDETLEEFVSESFGSSNDAQWMHLPKGLDGIEIVR